MICLALCVLQGAVEAGMTVPLFLKVVGLSSWEVRAGSPVNSWAGRLEGVLVVVEGPAQLVEEVEDTEVRPHTSVYVTLL